MHYAKKDENGIYIKQVPEKQLDVDVIPDPRHSIDDLLKLSITGLERAVKYLVQEITAGNVTREVIGNLKDCTAMLHDLKEKEGDLLDSLSDDALEKLAKK